MPIKVNREKVRAELRELQDRRKATEEIRAFHRQGLQCAHDALDHLENRIRELMLQHPSYRARKRKPKNEAT